MVPSAIFQYGNKRLKIFLNFKPNFKSCYFKPNSRPSTTLQYGRQAPFLNFLNFEFTVPSDILKNGDQRHFQPNLRLFYIHL
jgi:hypothetical protein